jgi:hypothetical protein
MGRDDCMCNITVGDVDIVSVVISDDISARLDFKLL